MRSKWMMVSLAAFAGLPLFYRFCSVIYSRIRLLVSLGRENQRFFAAPPSTWASFVKKHVIYSPLFRVRHNREFQLSTAVNVGTLPTRFQTFFLIGYLVGNIVFCTFMIDYAMDTTSMLGEVRNRTGVLSVVNMVPLFLLAGRNNPLIQLLGISFDTYNLIHRWLGRIVVLEAVAHMACWMAAKVMNCTLLLVFTSSEFDADKENNSWLGGCCKIDQHKPVHPTRFHCKSPIPDKHINI